MACQLHPVQERLNKLHDQMEMVLRGQENLPARTVQAARFEGMHVDWRHAVRCYLQLQNSPGPQWKTPILFHRSFQQSRPYTHPDILFSFQCPALQIWLV